MVWVISFAFGLQLQTFVVVIIIINEFMNS